MTIGMIFLLLGAFMLFIAAFGGGFEFKGFTIPKINKTSRGLGFLVGGVFLLVGAFVGDKGNFNGSVSMPWMTTNETKADPDPVSTSNPTVSENNPEAAPEEPPAVSTIPVALEQYKKLDKAWQEAVVDNGLLLDEYKKLKNSGFQDLSITQKDAVISRIEDLSLSIEKMAQLVGMDTKNTTLVQRLMQWRKYVDIPHLNKGDQTMAKQQVDTYMQLINSFASIANTNNFLICEKVVHRKCQQEADNFSLDSRKVAKVWVWAKVNAPDAEKIKLTLAKLDNDTMVKNINLSVKKSPEYRTYKVNTIKEPGQYEARLYNSKNELIGLRTFAVN